MIIRADARHIPLKDKSVQCCVTSPPYWGLRDYGNPDQIGLEKTPEEYVASLLEVFREVRRVLRDNGSLWINLGDSYTGSGRGGDPKYNLATQKSNKESKPDWNLVGLKPKNLVGIPWRVAFALQYDGWYLRSDIIWSKPNPMPESVRDRPTKAHEYIFLLSKSERYFYDIEAVKEPASDTGRISGIDGRDEPEGARPPGSNPRKLCRIDYSKRGRNIRSVWNIATTPYSGAHFATFPREIPERCIKAGSKPGDVILDPFCGSGTTVMVAQDLGRTGIGLDLTYQELASQRIGGSLFAKVVNSAFL